MDWFRLLWELRVAQGLSLARVARKVGVSAWLIRAIWNGHEPKHSLGEQLLRLQKKEQKPLA